MSAKKASDKRFYLPYYKDNPDRPVYVEDIGNLLKISGVIFQGMGAHLICLTPSGSIFNIDDANVVQPSFEEWGDIIRRSDDPEIFIGDVGGLNKILHRKVRWEISGVTQQKVWARDNFKCMYCGRQMGEVQLTIDHFIPLELGGANDTSNYLSACKRCNKDKGMREPLEFCTDKGYDYSALVRHLRNYTMLKETNDTTR